MRIVAVVAALVVVFSGCAGNGGARAAVGPGSGEGSLPLADDAPTGTVHGRVVSDEAQPLEGAEVALVPADRKTKTGADGSFRLERVPVGEQTLYANKLGFEQRAQRVQVTLDEEIQVNVTLVGVAVPDPRVDLRIGSGFFPCAFASPVFSTFDCTVNLTGTSRSAVTVAFDTDELSGIVFETAWKSSTTFSAQWLRQYHYMNGKQVGSASGPTGLRLQQVGPFDGKKVSNFESYLPTSAAAQPVALAMEQKFELYSSAFYEQPLPEAYSALPPDS